MKYTFLLLSFFILFSVNAQEAKDYKDAKKFQQKMNKEFSSKEESPLTEEDLENFKSLEFYPIDSSYIVVADLILETDSKPFKMKTTTDRLPLYKLYATANFELKGKRYSLEIYQNEKLLLSTDYEDYLFLPFTDLSNGNGSYGGGRYLDLTIPSGDQIVLDFNQSYNPYCAYNEKYSCPIPPEKNHIDTEVQAGVMAFQK